MWSPILPCSVITQLTMLCCWLWRWSLCQVPYLRVFVCFAGGTVGGLPDGICRLLDGSTGSSSGYPSPPAKRPKRDFSMYRTPSGKYYCSCCNVAVSSDMQFAQHVDSRKHKMNNAVKRNAETNNNTPEANTTWSQTLLTWSDIYRHCETSALL